MDNEKTPDASGKDVAAQQDSTGKSVAKATAGIVPMHLARFVIGFLAQPLIAHSTGLRWQADAYAVSSDIIQRIWLIFEKVLNPAFLPCFIGALKEEGEERAWKLTSTAIWLTAIALIFATALAWFGMPNIVGIYTPPLPASAKPETMADRASQIVLTIELGRLLLSGLFFLGMSSLTYTILNGYKRFAMAAFGDTLWKLGLLCGALAVKFTHAPPEAALRIVSMGYIAGAFFKLAPHLLAIGAKWKLLRPRIDLRDPLLRKVLIIAVPLIIGITVSESRGIYLMRLAADGSIAEKIEAGRAALKWSRIIGDNLIQIFPYALSIGIFPFLADLAREKDKQPLTDTLIGALRICIFAFAPITAILIALRFPLLRAVWEGGRMTDSDTLVMSGPFIGFSLGLIAFSCEMILNQTFYAMTRAWTPTIMGLIATVVWITCATFGVQSLGWGLLAIAGAESLAKSLKCILMWIYIRPHLGAVPGKKLTAFCAKVALAAVLAAAVAGAVGGKLADKVVRSSVGPTMLAQMNGEPGSALFQRDDLHSTTDMMLRLRDGDDELSRALFKRTGPKFQWQLKATEKKAKFDEALKTGLIAELNQLAQGPNLYDSKLFAGRLLKAETKNALGQNPQGEALVRLNRSLLEDAYGAELVKRPNKVKMLLAVTIAGLLGMFVFCGFGAVLKIEEVKQLGKLGGKIRAKLARK